MPACSSRTAKGASSTPTRPTRGLDMLSVAYHYMDLVPKGRDEDGKGQFWVRRRDEYPY